MELYDVMRTTFAAREYTDDPVSDEALHRIFDNARFAPTGGNRQGGKIIVVRDNAIKRQLGELCWPAARVYLAQRAAGESPWNAIIASQIDADAVGSSDAAPLPIFENLDQAPVVLIAVIDLRVVASTDKELDRIGVISGGSIYPLVWNILLGARNEGLGGVLTTIIASAEPAVQELLNLEPHEAVAALLPIGRPVKQLTKLSRHSVEDFVVREVGDGEPFTI
ncbi:MAG: nitroreductase family protein [Actinomycetia bacterium]|nr:nitroreductase family protein [Actinomycetes bacterium]